MSTDRRGSRLRVAESAVLTLWVMKRRTLLSVLDTTRPFVQGNLLETQRPVLSASIGVFYFDILVPRLLHIHILYRLIERRTQASLQEEEEQQQQQMEVQSSEPRVRDQSTQTINNKRPLKELHGKLSTFLFTYTANVSTHPSNGTPVVTFEAGTQVDHDEETVRPKMVNASTCTERVPSCTANLEKLMS